MKKLFANISTKFLELDRDNNTQFLRVVGVKRPTAYYDLDVVISVEYYVNSKRGIALRKWDNTILKGYCKG